MKKCSKCKQIKSRSEFDKSSSTKTGLQCQCKECRRAYAKSVSDRDKGKRREHYLTNREKILEDQRNYRKENPDVVKATEQRKYKKNSEHIKSRVSQYQKDNPEVNRRASKKYRDANPHLGAAKTAKRRARLAKATPRWFDDEFEQLYISEIFLLAQQRTEATGVEWHVDHITPLTSDTVCGLHCSSNLQVLTAFENISKSNRYWPDMPLQCDELLAMIVSFKQTQGETNERRI